ncbi:DUF2905 family protein [Pseudonocardia sp. Cha107L01]|uniref:DUF2905 family protein n=1 Tax=Pseudonocardia sp. Cha107L01 TaxID=3457576 RepID=UPI00403E75AB
MVATCRRSRCSPNTGVGETVKALGPSLTAGGIVLVLVGVLAWTGALAWLGNLPGDIRIVSGKSLMKKVAIWIPSGHPRSASGFDRFPFPFPGLARKRRPVRPRCASGQYSVAREYLGLALRRAGPAHLVWAAGRDCSKIGVSGPTRRAVVRRDGHCE